MAYEEGPAFFLLTSFQSLETLSSSFRVSLNFCYYYLLSFSLMIHGWHCMSLVLINMAGFPSFLISFREKRCCMHLHMKSWAWVDRRFRIFLISKKPLLCWGVYLELFAPPWTAWRMQHELERLVMELRASSEITSRPPVAAITKRTPRSKMSSFFNSCIYGDSFLLESFPPGFPDA